MTEENKVYELSEINDILDIPLEKLDEFFEHFVNHIKQIKAQRDAIELYLGKHINIKDELRLDKVVWTDDGDPSHNITVTAKEE